MNRSRGQGSTMQRIRTKHFRSSNLEVTYVKVIQTGGQEDSLSRGNRAWVTGLVKEEGLET